MNASENLDKAFRELRDAVKRSTILEFTGADGPSLMLIDAVRRADAALGDKGKYHEHCGIDKA